jgi:beta-glucosidase
MTSPRLKLTAPALALGLLTLALSVACGGGSSAPPQQQGAPPPTASPDVRADYVLKQMTLDEKIQLVHGGASSTWWLQTQPRGAAGWMPGIPRLGVTDLYLAYGSVGVGNVVGQATALLSSLSSAASLDLNSRQIRYSHGTELRDFGINVNLGGNVN